MKKLLSTLGAISLIASSATAVVACGDSKETIYLILPENPNTQWQNFIDTATKYVTSDETLNAKYKVRWASSDQKAEKELENTKAAVDGGAAAIIIGQNNQDEREAAKYVNENNIPLIGVNIPFSGDAAANEKPNYQVIQEYDKGSTALGEAVTAVLKKYKPDQESYGLYEIWGVPSMNGVQERHDGFKSTNTWNWVGNSDLPSDKNNEGVVGNWVDTQALDKTISDITAILSDADVVYGHNDGMARAALTAIKDQPGGTKKLTTTFNEDGTIKELGLLVVGYDYDTISVDMIANWGKDGDSTSTTTNLFATMEMSAIEMANKAMAKAIQEIQNGNKNKQTATIDGLTIALHQAIIKEVTS